MARRSDCVQPLDASDAGGLYRRDAHFPIHKPAATSSAETSGTVASRLRVPRDLQQEPDLVAGAAAKEVPDG